MEPGCRTRISKSALGALLQGRVFVNLPWAHCFRVVFSVVGQHRRSVCKSHYYVVGFFYNFVEYDAND